MHPILFQSPELILYSYPLLMGLGWGVGYQIFFSFLDPRVSKPQAQILFWGIFIAAWAGAKTLFYLSYPGASAGLLSEVSFWTGGGFVFYGGLIGALIFLSLMLAMNKDLTLEKLWPLLPALAVGHGIGRIGCLLAGCCFGETTDALWGIVLHGHKRHPTQVIEALGLFLLGFYLLRAKASRAQLVAHYFIGYGLLRLWVEHLRGDIVRGSWLGLSPSQWISGLLLIFGFSLLVLNKSKHLRKPN